MPVPVDSPIRPVMSSVDWLLMSAAINCPTMQVDLLVRRQVETLMGSAAQTLGSLARLLDTLPNLPISHEVIEIGAKDPVPSCGALAGVFPGALAECVAHCSLNFANPQVAALVDRALERLQPDEEAQDYSGDAFYAAAAGGSHLHSVPCAAVLCLGVARKSQSSPDPPSTCQSDDWRISASSGLITQTEGLLRDEQHHSSGLFAP